jgi:hypothetical protein
LQISREALELAVAALKTVATSTHNFAAEECIFRPGRALQLRQTAERIEAAAREIRDALRRLDQDRDE